MQTFTTKKTPLQPLCTEKFNKRAIVNSLRLLVSLFLFSYIFNASAQAQQCAYNISLVSRTYHSSSNRTVFVWKVFNPNPGNGTNGTVQDLSHWGFTINPCSNPADALHENDIIHASTGYSPDPDDQEEIQVEIKRDPSQNCTGETPVLKFDKGTHESTPRYYSLILSGNWGTADLHAYYKSGSRTGCGLCTIAGAGVGCRTANTCPAITVIILADLSQFAVNRTVALSTNITGGATPFTYVWSSTTSGVTFNNTTSANPTATVAAGITTFHIKVNVTDANGCEGTATITLTPGGSCNIAVPHLTTNPICPGSLTGTITITNPQVGVTYQLLHDGTAVGTAITYTSGTLSFTGLAAGTYSVRATRNDCNPVNCDSITITNIIVPAPTFNSIGTLCPGATVTLNATFPSGTTVTNINWSGTGVSGTTFTAPATPGNYTITFTATVNGCSLTATRSIAVANAPSPTFGTIGTLCPGATVTLTATFPSGTTATNIVWTGTGVSGNIFTAPASGGNYTITFSASVNGCVVNGSLIISVATVPAPTFNTIGTLCPGATASLSATFPSGTTVTNINWSGTGVSGTTFTAPATPGNYTITFNATVNGCSLTATRTITVATAPSPVFGAIGTLCPGSTATLTAIFPAGTTVTNVIWSGTGVSGTTFTAPATAGTYTVNFSATVNGCTVTGSLYIVVAPAPTPVFGTIGTLCPGATATLTATFPAGTTVTNVVWSGTGVSGATFTAPSSGGSYTINFSATVNGCVVNGSFTINVATVPAPTFNTIGTLCPGSTATLSATFPSGTTVTNFSWSGTGVSGTTFTAPSSPGNYTVTFSATVNGCSLTATRTITVANAPTPVFGAIGALCPGATAVLSATFPAGTTVTNIIWSGTGVSGSTFTAPASAGAYTVNFSATVNGCSVTGSFTITVVASPANNFTLQVTSGGLCSGGGGSFVLTLSGSQIGVNYQLMRDGANVGAPVAGTGSAINFAAQTTAGSYSVLAIATSISQNTCIACSVIIGPITVSQSTVPNPTFGTIGTLCPGSTATLTATFPTGTTVTNVVWSGAGVSGTTFTAPAAGGNYIITYSATVNGCPFTTTMTIAVTNVPAPAFGAVGTLCPGSTASLIATFPAGTTVANISWSGTGVSGTTFTAPVTGGNYTVNFSATVNGCPATGTMTITVATVPAPTFGSIGTLCPGSTATLTATFPAGTTVTNVVWSGTGVSGNIFTAPSTVGTYAVNFSATVNGCLKSGSLMITVATAPSPTFTNIGPLCSGVAVQLIATYPSGTTVTNVVWSGIGVTGSVFTAPSVTTPTNYTVNYSATVNSCTVTGSIVIAVNPVPRPLNLVAIDYCPGGIGGIIVENIEAGVSYQIRIVGGATVGAAQTGAAGSNLTFNNISAGYYQILSTYLNTGCVNAFGGVTVSENHPAPCTVTGPTSVCMGTTNTYTVQPGPGATNIQWSVQGGNCIIVGVSTTTTASIKAVGPGNFIVRATVSYGNCTTTCELTVTSTALTVSAGDFIACPNSTITLTGTPAGGVWASANPLVQAGINNSNSTFNSTGIPVGNYPVTYTVTQSNGCTGTALGSITVFGAGILGRLSGIRMQGFSNRMTVTMSDSRHRVTYQLTRNGSNEGAAVEGNGGQISFGTHEATGLYCVVARTEDGNCLITGRAVRLSIAESIGHGDGDEDGDNDGDKDRPKVVAFPNPFSDQIRFSISSPQSGPGTLELFDLQGAKLKTIDIGNVKAGETINVDYAVPGPHRVSMVYKLKIGDHVASGKLINIK